ncbi:hypothetical protein [Okeania sp.]|uniref:hypothetical protein n=1 Tax=Okeania sp. TaxID=3100323 RepID=UPI002B4B2772|nr:hypothetical protein [Okeania sp.]MEB3339216.1 hypothetical protein [Okeania sp.]
MNLSIATKDEIQAALKYLIESSKLKQIELAKTTERITEAPRQNWKTLEPITKLKCGIGKSKINALKEIFYLFESTEL